MISVEKRQSTVPVYVNIDACTPIYRNSDDTQILPITSPVSQTSIRKVTINPVHPSTLYTVNNYALSLLPQGSLQRFLLDSTPLLSDPAIVDNLNIFTIYKQLEFYLLGLYDTVEIPVKLRLDLFDVSSIPAIRSVLTHPDVSQLYIRSDTGHSATTYEMLQSVKHRNKVNLAVDLQFDFRLNCTNRSLLNLHLAETEGILWKVVTDTDKITSNSLSYKGKSYRKARKLSDLSDSGCFFIDKNAVYIPEWGN